jgi:hypothetical protein
VKMSVRHCTYYDLIRDIRVNSIGHIGENHLPLLIRHQYHSYRNTKLVVSVNRDL